jgi:hypothetical protein
LIKGNEATEFLHTDPGVQDCLLMETCICLANPINDRNAKWQTNVIPDMPEKRVSHAMINVNGRVIVIGGRRWNHEGGARVYAWRENEKKWTQLKELPQNWIFFYSAALVDRGGVRIVVVFKM